MRSRGVIKERKVSKKLCKASWDSKQLLLKIRTLPQLIFHAAETHTHTLRSQSKVYTAQDLFRAPEAACIYLSTLISHMVKDKLKLLQV